MRGRKEKKKVLRAMSHPFGETSLPHPTGGKGGLDGTTELSATSAKFNVGLGAPSCPVNLRVDRELLQFRLGGCRPVRFRRQLQNLQTYRKPLGKS